MFVLRARTAEDARRFVHDKRLNEELACLNDPLTGCWPESKTRRSLTPKLLELGRQDAHERAAMWLNTNKSACVELPQDGPEKIIIMHASGKAPLVPGE
jgi:hypothetical protein